MSLRSVVLSPTDPRRCLQSAITAPVIARRGQRPGMTEGEPGGNQGDLGLRGNQGDLDRNQRDLEIAGECRRDMSHALRI